MNSNVRWTKEEESFLEREYPTNETKEVAEALGRTVRSVYRKTERMGIAKGKIVKEKKEKDEMTPEKERILSEIKEVNRGKKATETDEKKCTKCGEVKLGKEFEFDYRSMLRATICRGCKGKALEKSKNKRIRKGRDW